MWSSSISRLIRNKAGVLGVLSLLIVPSIGLPSESEIAAPVHAGRFQILEGYKGEAVLDTETQLIWERTPRTAESVWANASLGCALSSTGGRLGWRLPSFFELMTLVEPSPLASGKSPSLPSGHPFRGVKADLYWTTDSQGTDQASAYAIDFVRGDLTSQRKNRAHAWWCVRGGVSNPSPVTVPGSSNKSI